uniref:hypothetical protein n=1 Tax=Nafulsella turpanensis TaxID=1265690 RepID=UPI000475A7FE
SAEPVSSSGVHYQVKKISGLKPAPIFINADKLVENYTPIPLGLSPFFSDFSQGQKNSFFYGIIVRKGAFAFGDPPLRCIS